MATTTPNYGWTVPTSTDLVKDGATAIETLGDAIDASMNTALGTKKAGMVLLNTTSFSGVSSQAVNACFSATYDNYRIVCRIESTSASISTILMRFGTGGTPNTSASYNTRGYYQDGTGNPLAFSASGSTSISIVTDPANGTGGYSWSGDVFNPFLAFETIVPGRGGSFVNLRDTHTIGFFDAATSFTDVIILPTSGNITGSVSVYGYNK